MKDNNLSIDNYIETYYSTDYNEISDTCLRIRSVQLTALNKLREYALEYPLIELSELANWLIYESGYNKIKTNSNSNQESMYKIFIETLQKAKDYFEEKEKKITYV